MWLLKTCRHYCGQPAAYKMGIGVIPMFRKDLPGDLVSSIYAHEYNSRRVLNLQKSAFEPGANILVIDYIMATGETMRRAERLIRHLGGRPIIFSLIELTNLNPRRGLDHIQVDTILRLDLAK